MHLIAQWVSRDALRERIWTTTSAWSFHPSDTSDGFCWLRNMCPWGVCGPWATSSFWLDGRVKSVTLWSHSATVSEVAGDTSARCHSGSGRAAKGHRCGTDCDHAYLKRRKKRSQHSALGMSRLGCPVNFFPNFQVTNRIGFAVCTPLQSKWLWKHAHIPPS